MGNNTQSRKWALVINNPLETGLDHSQIILDSTSAAEQIPKDTRGRFITGDGTVFQGYLFDEGRF